MYSEPSCSRHACLVGCTPTQVCLQQPAPSRFSLTPHLFTSPSCTLHINTLLDQCLSSPYIFHSGASSVCCLTHQCTQGLTRLTCNLHPKLQAFCRDTWHGLWAGRPRHLPNLAALAGATFINQASSHGACPEIWQTCVMVLPTAAAVRAFFFCWCCLTHAVLTVQGGIYPKLAGHIAHFLAQTLFRTCLIALTTAEYR